MGYHNAKMSSQVFYRKWRPQSLSEVVGQEHVTQTLRHAVDKGRIAHAYLFCGPRGTGKTSTGRILAKAVNCLNPVEGEPCNNCEICKAINDGNLMDVIEIDAASNRGIDEIRELRERVSYTPGLARYKVYIIDEVHMITKEAANAFLKTLEEPPAHSIFILATTEPHKVIATVLSRCQRFDFRRLSQSAVIFKLEYICRNENIKIDSEALRLITKVTTGSLRDAENLLEQLVNCYGDTIELEHVQALLGLSGDIRVKELAQHILKGDIAAGLRTINNVSNDGIDLKQFNKEFIAYLRELVLVKSGSQEVVDTTGEEMVELVNLAGTISLDTILLALKAFCNVDFRTDNFSPLPLELALLESILNTPERSQSKDTTAPDSVPRTKEPQTRYTTKESKPKATEKEKVIVEDEPALSSADDSKESGTEEPEVVHDEVATEPEEVVSESTTSISENGQDIDYLRTRWKDFVKELRGEGSTGNLDAFFRSACEPVSVEGDVLTVGFYHAFHKNYIEDPKYKFLVEKKLRDVFNQPYKLRCIIIERSKSTRVSSRAENPVVQAALERGAKRIDE
jgi:DNA polymerase-3 subunit gamma/tau